MFEWLKKWFVQGWHDSGNKLPICECEVIELLPRPKIPERRGSPLTAQKAVEQERRKGKQG
jgi:hypothetical protein